MSPRPLLAFVLCAAASCGESETSKMPPGQKLFFSLGCIACHGSAGEGTFMGPPLRGVSEHWNRESLARFIADPASVSEHDPRLRALAEKYRAPMKPIAAAQADRELVAEFVLNLR